MFIELTKSNQEAHGINIDNINYVIIDDYLITKNRYELCIEIILYNCVDINHQYLFICNKQNMNEIRKLYQQDNDFYLFNNHQKQPLSEQLLKTEGAFLFRKSNITTYHNKCVVVKNTKLQHIKQFFIHENINEIKNILFNHSQLIQPKNTTNPITIIIEKP